MTSTEITAGIGEGCRTSSKVLKPPGGGSSDIFGLGNASNLPSKSASEKRSVDDSSTRSRLFGACEPPAPAKNTLPQSNMFENGHQAQPTRTKKVYVRRNPITGEEIEINLESENEGKNDCDNEEVKDEAGVNIPIKETVNIPSKPVQTSIRVRNPPGGKSSGIF